MDNPSDLVDFNGPPMDIFSVGSYKLAAFPSFLVLGIPIWNGTNLTFRRDSYIKIDEVHLPEWLKTCAKFPDIVSDVPEFFDKDTIICSDNCSDSDIKKTRNLIWFVAKKAKKDCLPSIQIRNEKCCLEFNHIEAFLFVEGVKTLFFKVFCYLDRDNYHILSIVQQKGSELPLLDKDSEDNFKKLLEIIQTSYSFDFNKVFYYAQLIRRHREILSLYKLLLLI
jgi:hypothetical protein